MTYTIREGSICYMRFDKKKKNEIINIENFIDYNKNLKVEEKTFKKLMFAYSVALKELTTKIEIMKDEFEILYDYKLIDHIDTRIKTPESIINKMEKRNLKLTYSNMIENINDIAGIRIVSPLKKDVFSIKNLIQNMNGINIIKEKDYITYPKKSGYSSYHLIVEIPIDLSKQNIYVKTEIQIRTLAMDFWANLEHKLKYKPEVPMDDKKKSMEWVNCAKIVRKLDNKIMRNY